MITRSNHPLGPAPRIFSLDVVETEAAGTDEISVREAQMQTARLKWAKGRASRFAERASSANAERLKRLPLTRELERIHAERQARKVSP